MSILGIAGLLFALTIAGLAFVEARRYWAGLARAGLDPEVEPYPRARLARRMATAILLEAVLGLAFFTVRVESRLSAEAELACWGGCMAMTLAVLLLARRDWRESIRLARGHSDAAAQEAMARLALAMELERKAGETGTSAKE